MQGIVNSLGHFADRKTEQNVSVVLTESTTLDLNTRLVLVDSSGGTVTLTLPPVGEANGCVYAIIASTGSTNAVTIQDQDDSLEWADVTLSQNNAGHLLWCDGRTWWILGEKTGTA